MRHFGVVGGGHNQAVGEVSGSGKIAVIRSRNRLGVKPHSKGPKMEIN